jgi:O-antigen/teichoic acid export membrane protein
VIVSLASNLMLIPEKGFVGASITSIIVHLTLTLLLLPQAFKTLPVRIHMKQFLQWLAFSALLFVFVFASRPLLTRPIFTAGMLGVAILWMGASAWITKLHKTLKV